jgi:sodium transport system permease protein
MIRSVYLKELRSLMRDRHVLLYSVALPAFLYPVLILGVLEVVLFVRGVEERHVSRVEVGAAEEARALSEFLRRRAAEGDLEKAEKIKVAPGTPPAETAALRERLLDRAAEIDAIVLAREGGADSSPGAPEPLLTPITAEIYYTRVRGSSTKARERLESLLADWRQERLENAAERLGEDPSFLETVAVEDRSHSTPEEMASRVAGLLLPLLMLLTTALGAYYPALDATVGEKERGTLETTLLAPVSRFTQVAGKYLAVTTCALASFTLNFGSLSFTLYHLSGQLSVDMEGFRLGLRAIVLIVAGAIFLAALLSALMMLLAFLARSFKEGQTYVTPIYLLTVAPVLVTTSPEIHLSPGLALVPLVNTALLFRDSLEGHFDLLCIALALGSSAASAGLALWAAARVLARETIATGDDVPLSRALAQIFRRRRRAEVCR